LLGFKFTVVAVDPEAIKFVLKEPSIIKVPGNLFASPKQISYFGKSMIAYNGDDWRRAHNIVSSGFTSQALSGYIPTFLELSNKALKMIPADTDFETGDFLSRFTIDVLGLTIFNHDYRRMEGKTDDRYYGAYQAIFITNPWKRMILAYPWAEKLPFQFVREHYQSLEILKEFFKEMIKEQREKGANDSVLSKLLQASGNQEILSDQEILSNIWLFFLAGHETTARAILWELHYLRLYPDIQEKVYEEIHREIGDREPQESDLGKLVYLDIFINEVLRIRSPAPIIRGRMATKDIAYKNMIIPKGATVSLYFHINHTNPDFWEDPLKFDPERFNAENKKGRHHFLYVPFGAGLRQCIGNNFSLIEQRIFLIRLLQKYRVVNPKEHKPLEEDFMMVLGVGNQSFVRFENR
jgi:cytochrome P450